MKWLVIITSLTLVGCAATGPQVVKVPVAVPCTVEEPVKPEYRFTPPYESLFEAVRDLLGDRELSQAYENELRIALKACR